MMYLLAHPLTPWCLVLALAVAFVATVAVMSSNIEDLRRSRPKFPPSDGLPQFGAEERLETKVKPRKSVRKKVVALVKG